MTGAELYALYQRGHALRNCVVDTWDELDEADREVWEAMAVQLNIGFSDGTY